MGSCSWGLLPGLWLWLGAVWLPAVAVGYDGWQGRRFLPCMVRGAAHGTPAAAGIAACVPRHLLLTLTIPALQPQILTVAFSDGGDQIYTAGIENVVNVSAVGVLCWLPPSPAGAAHASRRA